ncbi:MAG: DUF4432 family protein, partial [Planctomycetaceae bacterium]|nr:DUF4432 family protein [Planctomycetaceae bacterium]
MSVCRLFAFFSVLSLVASVSTAAPIDEHLGGCTVKSQVLHGGKQEGVELVTLNNGNLEITVVPTRGMNVLKVRQKDGTGEWADALGWNSPVKQMVHPSYINLDSRGGLGWLDGFNEWMVRCGLEFAGHPGTDKFIDNTGAEAEMELTLHGKVGNIPAASWTTRQEGDRVVVSGIVNEQMFFGPKFKLVAEISTTAGSDTFQIRDVIVNEGSAPQEMMLLYHCNFGRPILEEGAQVVIAAESLRPMNAHAAQAIQNYHVYKEPTAGFIEEVFLAKPKTDNHDRTAVLLKNNAGDAGCTMSWSTKQLPYLTIWKNTVDERDGYVTGLEPGTCFPYNRNHERQMGRVMKLEPGREYEFAVDVQVHASSESVKASANHIRQLQGNTPPRIYGEPEGDEHSTHAAEDHEHAHAEHGDAHDSHDHEH